MKKHLKLIIFITVIVLTYLIYEINNNNNITYLTIGDAISLGENSYGATNYGYSDYFKDYLQKENLLSIYNKTYTSKTKTITELYNDILLDESITIDNDTYNLKRLLREADIITISIGLNDIIESYNLSNKFITSYEQNRIVDNVFNKYKNLIEEMKKYYHYKIYVIGYYERNTKYDSLIYKLNNKYKKYVKINKDIFIDTSFLSKNNLYFNNPNSYYPNNLGYKKIANKIIRNYKK